MNIAPTLAVSPLGSLASRFALGGGVRTTADRAPLEHCAAWSAPTLVFATGNGNADGHAQAYFDAALPAQWLTGFAAGYASHGSTGEAVLAPSEASTELRLAWEEGQRAGDGRNSSPEAIVRASAASLAQRIRVVAAAERSNGFDVVSFRLKGTHVDLAVGRFEKHGSLRYAVVGDIALFRLRDGVCSRIERGGTLLDDQVAEVAAGKLPTLTSQDLELLGGITTSAVDGLDGTIYGTVRTGTTDFAPGDRLLWTSRGIHHSVDEALLATLAVGGSVRLLELREEIASSENLRSWPSAALLEVVDAAK